MPFKVILMNMILCTTLMAGIGPQPKPEAPLVQDLNPKTLRSKLSASKGLDRELLTFSLGVAYFNTQKWNEAFSTLNTLPNIKFLDRHIKYFKSASAINIFNDEGHLKKALEDMYYLDARGGATSEDTKQYASKAEFKLALIKARAGDYISALDLLSRSRRNNYSNLESEFELAKLFMNWDKKLSRELMLELYKRFGERSLPYFNKLNQEERAKLELAILAIKENGAGAGQEIRKEEDKQALFEAIRTEMNKRNDGDFKSLSIEYLRKYNKPSDRKKYYSSFSSFIEELIYSKRRSASFVSNILEHYDRDYLEKLALKLWQKSDWKNTEYVLKMLSRKYPYYDKGIFLTASFYEDTDRRSKALDNYKLLIDEFSQSYYYQRSLFKYGWLKMLDGDNRTCSEVYSRYLAEGGDSYDWSITPAMYFRSRCLAGISKKEESTELKKELISRYPFSFYALIAMDELGMDIVKSLDESIKPKVYSEDAISPQDVYTINTASRLVRAGVFEWARKELGTINLDRLNAEYLELVSDMFRYANMHDMAFIAAGKLLLNLKGYNSIEHAQAHFPQPYMELVDNFSKTTGVEPFVIFAIMKRESAFNKDAVSKAGALGLMQLMPYTAERVEPGVDSSKLKDAETNVRLASLYLKKLFEKYKGNLVYIAAAYNAGEESLDRWVKWYGSKMDKVEFIENIPYMETRAYVKSVVANYYMYNALYLKKKVDFDDLMSMDLKTGERR